MNAKEQWIDTAIKSLDGVERAALSPFVREKILRRMQNSETVTDSVKFSLVWKIAAVILLLISLNVFTILSFSKSSGSSQNSIKSRASEYFSYIDHYNL